MEAAIEVCYKTLCMVFHLTRLYLFPSDALLSRVESLKSCGIYCYRMAGKRRKVVRESEPDLELDFDLGDWISFGSEDYVPSSDLNSDDGESGCTSLHLFSPFHFCFFFLIDYRCVWL